MRRIITLTTDFGEGSSYAAQMKGVILSMNPDVCVVDVTHSVPPQNIRQGATILAEMYETFPPDTIHVAVVDPGVGTDRKIVYVRVEDQHFVAPDNGLLSLVTKKKPPAMTVDIRNEAFWRENVSATFHGRDIMAPVAAHLSLGVDPHELGEEADRLMRLSLPAVRIDENEIRGNVVSFDSFGNLITDITADTLKKARRSGTMAIRCGNHVVRELVHTYGHGMAHTLVALIGSSGMLELSVVNGNAAQRLGIELGAEVLVTW